MKPSLLGDVGEDEVGVRLGQEEELLHALHVAAAGESAGADGDQRLVDVEAGALRVGGGIEKDQHTLATPGNQEEQSDQRRQRNADRANQILPLDAGQKEHHRSDAGQHQRRAQIGLTDDEKDKDHGNQNRARAGYCCQSFILSRRVERNQARKRTSTGLANSEG